MYFRNFTTLFVKYSYLYFSSHGVYGSKVKKGNKHQYVNECHLMTGAIQDSRVAKGKLGNRYEYD